MKSEPRSSRRRSTRWRRHRATPRPRWRPANANDSPCLDLLVPCAARGTLPHASRYRGARSIMLCSIAHGGVCRRGRTPAQSTSRGARHSMPHSLTDNSHHGAQTQLTEHRHHRHRRPRLAGSGRQSARRPASCASWRVWLPPGYDEGTARGRSADAAAAIRCCSTSSASPDRASRTSTGARSTRTFPSAPRASSHERKMGPCIIVFPDCFTVPRRQPVHQFVGDRRLRRLPDARADPVRRSRVPHAGVARRIAAASASRRAATARSSTA